MVTRYLMQRQEKYDGPWHDIGLFNRRDAAEDWERMQVSAHPEFLYRIVEVDR